MLKAVSCSYHAANLYCAGGFWAHAVADDGLPLLFKQCLQLGEVLDDDADADLPGAHGGQQLVKFIGQCDVSDTPIKMTSGQKKSAAR